MTASLLSRPDAAAPSAWTFPKVQRMTLAGGIGLATCHLPGQAVIQVRLVLPGGARSDPAGYEGLSMIAGRAAMEGTRRLDVDEFADAVERLGARIHAEPHMDATVLAASCPVSRLADLLGLLAEVVSEPGFRDDDVDRVIRQRREEAVLSRTFPQSRVGEVFAASAFASGTRRSIGSGGSPESLSGIATTDVVQHWARTAQPAGATLAVVGDLAGTDVSSLAESALGSWVGGGSPLDPPAPVQASTETSLKIVDMPGAVQTQLLMGHALATVPVDERATLRVAVHAIGGHFGSLLNTELREHRGVTYGVSSSVDHGGGASVLAVGSGVQADATADSVEEILRQINAFAASPDVAAVDQAKDNLVRTGPAQYRSAGAVAGTVVRNTIERLPDDYDDRFRAAVAATTPDEAAAALARHWGPDRVAVAAVGDASSIASALEKVVGVEPVVEPI